MKKVSLLWVCILLLSCDTPKSELTIAFGSCAKQWEEQWIWEVIGADKPDLFLFLGDAIYADWNGEKVVPVTDSSLAKDWRTLQENVHYRNFSDSVPILATWDNHDYGTHDGGKEFILKNESKHRFLQNFGIANDPTLIRREGIYQSKYINLEQGVVQIIMLDTKWFRSKLCTTDMETIGSAFKYKPCLNDSSELLGEVQWQWLEDELRKTALVRIICSSTQVIPNQKGMDEWSLFPKEREKLLKLLSNTEGESLILSGNVHFGEISGVSRGDQIIYECTSSGLTHVDLRYSQLTNSFRIGEMYDELNYGVVHIYKKEVSLQVRNIQGETVIQKVLNL